ncbi:MAG: hypothetical protein FJY67_00455 [Calditrichaeota bacterium]|nr:hypothetical protein [Calditrichota bacterium]
MQELQSLSRSEDSTVKRSGVINLIDLASLIYRWRKLFILNFVAAAVLTSVVSFMLPVWYRATTVVLPPSGSSSGLPGFLSKDLASAAVSFGLEVPTDEIYETILGSRELRERLIKRYDLSKVYQLPSDIFPEEIIRQFNARFLVTTRKDRSIELSYEERSAELAAEIANGAVEELDRIYRDITSESARKSRIFIEKRLTGIIDSLATLQDSLVRFQLVNNAIAINEQTGALINTLADLKAEQLSASIKVDVLAANLGPQHPAVRQLRLTAAEIEARTRSLIDSGEGQLYMGLQTMPHISRTYVDIMRRIRVQSSLLEFTYPQYESARIQEERESANVQVLDRAYVPNKKSRPARRMIVTVSVVAAMVLTLLAIAMIEYWQGLPERHPQIWQRIMGIGLPGRRSRIGSSE